MWFCVLVFTLACFDPTQSCKEELKKDPESSCNKCPAGFHKDTNTSKCRKCIGQSFTAIPNELSECIPCKRCDIGGSVCKSGFNKDELKRCQPCQMKECTTTSTPKLPNSTPNPTITKNIDTSHLLYNIMYVLLVLLVTTLLMACLLVLTKGGWRGHSCCANPEKEFQLPTRDTSANDANDFCLSAVPTKTLNITDGIPMMTLAHSAAKTEYDPLEEHWPATVLYAIIKEVPLRRWKEFLRVLSLPDRQLERVELEPGLGSIEKQYQMLRLWSQGPTASLEDVYSALLYMDLAGCVYQLQD
ncbi:unnamed protein product, partial [Coregonus sp. 'balchen']